MTLGVALVLPVAAVVLCGGRLGVAVRLLGLVRLGARKGPEGSPVRLAAAV